MRDPVPPVVDLVLVGGGHSHVQVLRSLGMRPLPGVRVTIISREVFTPYSGMLPGHVAGYYSERDIHIDLGPLARFAGARLLAAEVTALDLDEQRIDLEGYPGVRFDVVSINTGAVPQVLGDCGVAVKPIGQFLPRWREVVEQVVPGQRISLVGGGAGGVELAMAMRRALGPKVHLSLVTETLLAGHGEATVTRLRDALRRHTIDVLEGFRVEAAAGNDQGQELVAEDGRRQRSDRLFWVTGVEAPKWLERAGLSTDAGGFVRVDRHLRSLSHPQVFAAGDVAALEGQARPKSGVYAVRQGPVLTANLRRSVLGGRLAPYRAQRRVLAIIGTADGRAVASRGRWSAAGRWVWWWKDWIDRRFMKRFQALPEMTDEPHTPRALRDRLPETMRCGGCGAKLGADPLRRVLARLPDQRSLEARQGVLLGIGDDAAVLRNSGAGNLVLTVDGFRSLLDDAYVFGRITAHHSLNDVIAMGAQGVAALAMASVPLMADAMMEEELYLLLKGAVDVLNDHGVPLVGGHSAEGGELSLALSITGAEQGEGLRKGGLRPGHVLLVTKPLGTGALLAAHMRGRLASDELAAAVASMDQSNAPALEILRNHQVSALTDVSGFGLLGHLGEMLRAGAVGATVCAGAVPLLSGARRTVADGIVSSLQSNNEGVFVDFALAAGVDQDERVRLLVDPQTSGGLLAGVPAPLAESCLAALRAAGYRHAAAIGTATDGPWQLSAP